MSENTNKKSIAIVGGCGHVGIPLGLAFAVKGFSVYLVDINQNAIDLINAGELPFLEEGAEPILKKVIGKNLYATNKMEIVGVCEVVFFVTGTPVDEHLNPKVQDVIQVIKSYFNFLKSDQLIILRSTVYPGVVNLVDDLLENKLGKNHPKLNKWPPFVKEVLDILNIEYEYTDENAVYENIYFDVIIHGS